MRLLVLAALVAATVACDRASTPNLSLIDTDKADAASPAGDAFAYAEADVASLQARMSRGELSSRALTQAYLDRIAAIDDAGPKLNAVIETNPLALQEAETRDAERRAGRVRGPLPGIPVLVKDNIDATPMANSAGSLVLADHQPKADAYLVRRLRDAGAVILGKTNLSEWANFRSNQSTSGWSSRGGLTRNPYVLDRNACGSSSGTGVAVAANLAALGVGTETDGSIICPSAVNGLVGIKPTVGLISRTGIIPISRTQDTAGPMARTVADAAALLSVMVGRDDRDPITADSAGRAVFDYEARLRDARLGDPVLVIGKEFEHQLAAGELHQLRHVGAGHAARHQHVLQCLLRGQRHRPRLRRGRRGPCRPPRRRRPPPRGRPPAPGERCPRRRDRPTPPTAPRQPPGRYPPPR